MVDLPHIGLEDFEMKGKGKGRYAGVEQHTFLTPEARRLLMDYLKYRQRQGEVLTPESPLFVNKMKRNGDYSAITEQTVFRAFYNASKHSGVHFTAHDMRRFGQTQLEEAGLQPNWIRKIVGHKIGGEESPYSRPNLEKLREGYRKALPRLVFIDHVTPMSEADRRKQNILDSFTVLFKDDPEKVAQLRNILARAKTMKQIDEALKEATR